VKPDSNTEGMALSDAIRVMGFAFTRERAALDSARCLVIGTAYHQPMSHSLPALKNLDAELLRLNTAEWTISAALEQLMVERAAKVAP
jgi:hypothetical protein